VVELIEKGVNIPNPFSIDIGDEINLDRISSAGVKLYPGTRIYGAKTLVSQGTKLGYEAPATIVDCQIGPHVELKGGFFKSSVFLEKANVAFGAQVREGCILEEEANANHTVGLKQTILFPFVTLGSLINFCDCLMAGGTSRKNHSEVGSSYIHFNYTPHQDKATPSLIGDVPRGVMLNQPPIFLGGQGGLVGPVRIGYGTVIAAGTVCRRDCTEMGRLVAEKETTVSEDFFRTGFYGNIKHRVYNNICYLANLLALRQWYFHVRQPFFQIQDMGSELYEGAMDKLEIAIEERLKRFKILSEKMEMSIELGLNVLRKEEKESLLKQKREFRENWPKLEATFTEGMEKTFDLKNRDEFIRIVHGRIKDDNDYIKVIQGLGGDTSALGTAWLQNIVNHVTGAALDNLPSFRLRWHKELKGTINRI
jgi:UDP-N-acetylglucosamine/UDP-N-acetylgalactosamine diphosphorylase